MREFFKYGIPLGGVVLGVGVQIKGREAHDAADSAAAAAYNESGGDLGPFIGAILRNKANYELQDYAGLALIIASSVAALLASLSKRRSAP